MLANFKKVGVAAAVAAALGASGAAHAVLQGVPGDALLIPHVATTGQGNLNTMISVIVADPTNVKDSQFPTLTGPKSAAGCDDAELHWFFFNSRSEKIADGFIPVTCDDWVGIDWGAVVAGVGNNRPIPSALGVPGYMVITDASASPTKASGMILYGAAFYIAGNWASQAFIPVLPLIDAVDGTRYDEVDHKGTSSLNEVNPVAAGMLLPGSATETAYFSMRYFVQDKPDDGVGGSTAFVLWFPDNSTKRGNQTILVFDEDETYISARTDISRELNILAVGPDAEVGGVVTGVVKDGLSYTGFVEFDVSDFSPNTSTTPSTVNGNGSRAGVAFSLIGVNGAVQAQIQTELAHERGVK
jgi:hypothetical protein